MSESAREEFRVSRLKEMDRVSADLFGAIDQALTLGLEGEEFANAISDALYASFLVQYEAEGVSPFAIFDSPRKAWEWFYGRVRPGLEAVVESSQAKRIADWLGTAVVNGAKVAGTESEGGKMWLSRRDDKVRPKHVEADGQVVPWGVPFVACGQEMAFPGEPVGDPECWLNCRCVAAPAVLPGPLTADGEMIETFGQHDLIWYENRRTPEVVAKGAKGKKGGAGTAAGKVVKRRPATAEEEKKMRGGKWLRVNRDGKTPGQPGYMERKSKVRPQNNAAEGEEFAADEAKTGKVIVAIPADDDPIWNVSSEPTPHMTMIWLGQQDFTPEDWGAILAAVQSAATQFGEYEGGPQELTVTGREPLGDDDADVLMLDPGRMANLRDYMLSHQTIKTAYEAVDQYPQWTPHLTLGYPETPAEGEPGETIRFDRLAVWDGDYEGEEYPMSVAVQEDAPAVEDDLDMEALDSEDFAVGPVPWNGVLAPEGIPSGDGRRFAPEALEWRDLPVPLLWQKSNGMGHEGAVIVGQINRIWRDNNLLRGAGFFADTPEADEAIGLLAEGHMRGVSVDVDSAEMAMEDEEGKSILFSKGRISAATLCAIPAFAEAYVVIGEWVEPEGAMAAGLVTPDEFRVSVGSPTGPVTGGEDVPLPFREYDTAARDRMAKDGIAMPDGSYPIADEEDLRNAIQAIGRAKDPKATRAHIVKRARALGKGDLIPEGWSAEGALECGCRGCDDFDCGQDGCACCWSYDDSDTPVFAPQHPRDDTIARVAAAFDVPEEMLRFKRGPGWVTDPVATKRIHDYWTKPGHEGYAKIAWGTPGDFRRLRAHLAKYIGPQFLNRTVAQWHHDALGYWPGEKGKPGNPMSLGVASPALHLVAAGGWCAPSEWFDDPSLDGPTALTVTEDGRIFGHLATWGTCHIGIPGTCTTPPHSASGYAYYMTGAVQTDDGKTVPVGQITMDTGHAPLRAGARAAAAHYDHTGAVVADVRAGEDAFGIWVAGAVRPTATEAQRRALMAGALSGDWRAIGGELELVASLLVNVPGFPIPRTSLAASGDRQESLVAAGIVIPTVGTEAEVEAAVADLVAAVADEVEARATRRARAASLLEDTRALRVAALLNKVEV